MQRTVRQIDVETGEVLEGGMMVYVQHRPKIREGWCMTFQDAFVKLAADRTITGEQLRVLLFLIGRLDFENWIYVPQTEICEALAMRAPHVSRAIAALTAKGLLTRGPKLGRVGTLRLSLHLGWKGRVRSLQAEQQKRHLHAVKSSPRAPSSHGRS